MGEEVVIGADRVEYGGNGKIRRLIGWNMGREALIGSKQGGIWEEC